jgi:hypothetical protein
MKRPNFFIVGAPKCGTTALYEYLKAHPQIYMSDVKEPHYFLPDSMFKTEADYLELFEGARDEIRLGEASPGYIYSVEATQAIHAFDPQAKIIIMVRAPVDLLYSTYWHHRTVGRETSPTFAEALEREKQSPTFKDESVSSLSYSKLPLLSRHIQRYFDVFGRESVFVITFDEFTRNTAAVYRETLEFLGVDPSFQTTFPVVNQRKRIRSQTLQTILLKLGVNVRMWKQTRLARRAGKIVPQAIQTHGMNLLRNIYMSKESAPPLDPELARQLRAQFAPEVQRLSDILGRDLSRWS